MGKKTFDITKDLKRGMKLRAIRDGSASYVSYKKGRIISFMRYTAPFGKPNTGFRVSEYGSNYPLSDFEYVTALEAQQTLVDQAKANITKAQVSYDAAVKKLETLKNPPPPPVKVGDTFRLPAGEAHYLLKFKDDDDVMYVHKTSKKAYTVATKNFKPVKV